MNANVLLQCGKENLQSSNKRLISDLNISLELQNSLQSEWKRVCKQCDDLAKTVEEIKNEKDVAEQVTQSHIKINHELNRKCAEVCKELNDMHVSSNKQAKNEILVWKSKLEIEKVKDDNIIEGTFIKNTDEIKETEIRSLEHQDIEGINYFSDKRRTNRKVLNSIKRSVTERDIAKLTLVPHSFTFEQIKLLHPNPPKVPICGKESLKNLMNTMTHRQFLESIHDK